MNSNLQFVLNCLRIARRSLVERYVVRPGYKTVIHAFVCIYSMCIVCTILSWALFRIRLHLTVICVCTCCMHDCSLCTFTLFTCTIFMLYCTYMYVHVWSFFLYTVVQLMCRLWALFRIHSYSTFVCSCTLYVC